MKDVVLDFMWRNMGKVYFVTILLGLAIVLYAYSINDTKSKEHQICIGGYQYELVVNEFNEPVWCGDNAE